MNKAKIISALWFGVLGGASSLLITTGMDTSGKNNEVQSALTFFLFFGFAFLPGYLLGHKILDDTWAGLWRAVYLGALIVVLAYINFALYALVINFNFNSIVESFLAPAGLLAISFLFSFFITIPIGVFGSLILWFIYSVYMDVKSK